jgi:hypothetical protein
MTLIAVHDELPPLPAIRATLTTMAAALQTLSAAALDRGDFAELDVLMDANQAVHRAAIALDART